MIWGELALVAASLFAGAALYITAVEQPARLGLDSRSLLLEWTPAYRRGTLMQGPLAIAGFVLGAAAFWQDRNPIWLVGAFLMIANWPWTLLVIMPTNRRLEAIDPAAAGPDVHELAKRWGALHAVRSGLGCAATLAFVAASLAAK